MLWGLLFFGLLGLVCVGFVYLVNRINQTTPFKKLGKTFRFADKIIPLGLMGITFVAFYLLFNTFTAIVVMLHLIIFWLVADLVAFVIKKITKKPTNHNIVAVSTLAFTVLYLAVGWYFAHHVFKTTYEIETDKVVPPLRIVQIADSHLSITLDGEDFAEKIKEIDKLSPDILLITGDFVDDDSSYKDMKRACEALGEIKPTYGIYFSFGNHDKGYSDAKDYTAHQLRQLLSENGVTILEDETVLVNDSFYIIGRQDTSVNDRKTIEELTSDLDKNKFMIVMDHQPNDYEKEKNSQVDLVLSGHTHGGHLFPAGFVGLLMGANDKIYGHEKIENTDFVVTSGISGWAIPFKTGAISEYVVIDVK